MFEHFRILAEAPLPQIHQMARDVDLPLAPRVYAQAVSFFMSGDIERLEMLNADVDKHLHSVDPELRKQVALLIRLRTRLRKQEIQLTDLHQVMSQELPDVLDAEKYFLLGRAWEFLSDDRQGTECSLKAAAIYQKTKCPKKSLRSFYNSVVADSRIFPYKNFVSEYQTVIEMSKQVQDLAFAGMAMTMLSREYQIVGLLEKALTTVEDGLLLLESERGSLHFYYALLHQAHLLIETKQNEKAVLVLLETQMASFPEIHATRRFLECLLHPESCWNSEDEKHMVPTWRERLPLVRGRKMTLLSAEHASATMLEERLLKMLWSGPVSKWELIEKIYPDEKDSLIVENRFKNLVGRVRKKFPGVLQFQGGQYFVEAKPTLKM